MCKVSLKIIEKILSGENCEDMRNKTKEEIKYMISEIENDLQLSPQQKKEYIQKLRKEGEELGLPSNWLI